MEPLPDFPDRDTLSPRQRQVVNCVLHGMSNKETARYLDISPRTVEDHRAAAYLKLGVRRPFQLYKAVYGGIHA